MTDKLTLTANRIVAVFTDAALFASDDQLRPVLNGVRVVAAGGRCQLVATDSYVLGTFTFDTEGTFDGIIALDDVKRIVALAKTQAKAYRSMPTDVVLERDGDTLTVNGLEASLSCRLVVGNFPEWPALFHEVTATEHLGFTTATLGIVAKVRLGRTARDQPLHLDFGLGGPLKPAQVLASHDGVQFRALIMPSKTAMPDSSAFAPKTLEVVKP